MSTNHSNQWVGMSNNPLSTMPHKGLASNLSPGNNHHNTGGRPKDHKAKQKCLHKTNSNTHVPGLCTFSYLSRIAAQPQPSFLCFSRTPPHQPSSPTSVYLVPALYVHPPSTPFLPFGTHPFFPDANTSQYSYLLYTITHFLFQLSYAPHYS